MSTTSKHLPPQRNEKSSGHPHPSRRPIRSTVAPPGPSTDAPGSGHPGPVQRDINYPERMRVSPMSHFLRSGPISPAVHGTLDYLLAAALIVLPLALNFNDDAATVIMLILGGAAAVLAVGTNWSRGIIRVLPPIAHGVADIGATIALIAAPFVFGFTDHTLATVLYIAIGASGLGATLLTRFESDLVPAPQAAQMRAA